jgi:hypothetical protein
MNWLPPRPRASSVKPSRRRRTIAALELLEGRALMATYTWISTSTGGNYNVAANWSGPNGINAVPGPTDDAVLPQAPYTVTITSAETVGTISCGGGSILDIKSGGSLTVNNPSTNTPTTVIANVNVEAGGSLSLQARTSTIDGAGTIAGTVNVASGATLDLSTSSNGIVLAAGASLAGAGSYVDTQTLTINGAVTAPTNFVFQTGIIQGTGTFTIPSGATFEWQAGEMITQGGTTNFASGSNLIFDQNPIKYDIDRTINDAATTTWSSAGDIEVDGLAVFTSSGNFTINNDQLLTGTGTFVNSGTLTKTSTTSTGTTEVTLKYNDSGTTISQSGILQLSNNGLGSGVFSLPNATSVINLVGSGASAYQFLTGASFTGSGTLQIGGQSAGGGYPVLNVNASVPNLDIESGTLSGTGNLTISGKLTLNNGSINLPNVTLGTGSTLLLSGSGVADFDTGNFTNNGTITLSGSETFELNNGATFTNAGSFLIQNDTVGGNGEILLVNGTFINTGSITKTTPSGPSGTSTLQGATNFVNDGTITATSGQLVLDVNGTSNGGHFTAAANAGLFFSRVWALDAGTLLSGTGNFGGVQAGTGSATVTVNTSLTIPNYSIPFGTLDVATGDTVTIPTLSVTNGTLGGAGSIVIPSGGTLLLNGGGTDNFDTATVTNNGTATFAGTENLQIINGATFNNAGSFLIQSDTNGGNGEILLSSAIFNNSGSITKTTTAGPSATTTISGGSPFNNSGTITASSGRLVLDNDGNSTGHFFAAASAGIFFSRDWNLDAGTVLGGTGNYGIVEAATGGGTVVANTNLTVADFSVPFGGLSVSAGATFTTPNLTVSGATLNGTGTISIPSGGTFAISGSAGITFDQVTINNAGSATWVGSGQISLSGDATIDNLAGGTFAISSDQEIFGGSAGLLENSGTLIKTSTSTLGTTTIGVTFDDLGGSVIDINSGNLSVGTLTNLGTIHVGTQSILKVTSAYAQAFAGTLQVDVGGIPASQLYGHAQITGTPSLNGTFTATLVNGFTPTPGQVYPVITYGAFSGNFFTTNLPTQSGSPLFSAVEKAAEYDLTGLATAPPAPTGLTLLLADDTGGPGTTAIHAPRLTGSATVGTSIQVYDQNSRLVATGVTGSNGVFTTTSAVTFAPGTYTLTAYAINGGAYSAGSASYSLTITPPPVAPTGLALDSADDTNGPGVTTVATPRFTGSSQSGLLIQVYDQNKRMVATGTVGSNGAFLINSVVTFTQGNYTLTAYAIDAGGNYGAASAPYSLTILTVPTAPTSLAIYAADDSGGPGVTAFHAPRLTGAAQAGTSIQIYDQNKRLVATATTLSNGTFVATPAVTFTPGTYQLTAYAISSAGLYSLASSVFSLTITPPPAAPTALAIFPGDDTNGPGITTVTNPRLTGQAASGTSIQIYDQNKRLVATGVVTANGTFVATSVVTYAMGTYTLTAYAIDAGGNYSVASSSFTLTIR